MKLLDPHTRLAFGTDNEFDHKKLSAVSSQLSAKQRIQEAGVRIQNGSGFPPFDRAQDRLSRE
jgi:hypothetical protein